MDTEKLLDEFRELIDFTELFWTIDDENVEEILDKSIEVVKKGLISYYTISDMINSFSNRNLKRVKAVIQYITFLFAKVPEFSFPQGFKIYNNLIYLILHLKYGRKRGISKSDNIFVSFDEYQNKSIDEIIDIYYSDKIDKSIIFDDLEGLQKSSAESHVSFDDKMLNLSARNGSINCFKYLLLNGCNISQSTFESSFLGNSYEIIHMCEEKFQTNEQCIKNAVLGHHNETVRYLIDKYEIDYTWEQTMLTYNFDLFFDKIQRAESIDERDVRNDTCLMICVRYNLYTIAKFLLRDFGANPNEIMTSFLNYPMIVYASSKQWNELLEILVEYKANCMATTDNGRSAIWFALKYKNTQSLKILQKSEGFYIDNEDFEGRTPLLNSAMEDDINNVKCLLEIGANVNAFDHFHKTPLIFSIKNGNYQMFKLFLNARAEMDLPGYHQKTPLFYAAKRMNLDMMQDLVDGGADVNHLSSRNSTPIFKAAEQDFEDGIKYLLEKGAKIDIEMNDKTTLLMAACKGKSIYLITYCVEHGLNVNAMNKSGNTPLIYSLKQNSLSDVQYLLNYGADPNFGLPSKKPFFFARHSNLLNILRQYGAQIE
ncbi:hypothetical protein TVAG_175660 [Trichomonas vaginalis G3]|uniref:DUF3447 domain-containing protein n=1 Tax=Trichomonas vaginalis (strain ATCC PRA-98 / G3) TaxID=412133 RepID=A2F5N4_TRIV3|nr:spectrin binding [Trichomonas vaginalis G3]EAX99797.1 hypothetical protein TVAG_175660 [Trichomonas vaginalis G3]KAI5494431.1 spectrin binding [Trichomonas vaginalis G3]|eukprot:XP_001312727.1 hypothetical protein [Trichomonas vaginalis G3]